MKINNDSLQEFRQDFNAAVEDLQEKYGLSINARVKFETESLAVELDVNTNDGLDRESKIYRKSALTGDFIRIRNK